MAVKELVVPTVNRGFVDVLRRTADTTGTWSVIGGFGVWCHLGESHRPTLDIDVVAVGEAHDRLVALGSPGASTHRRSVDGVDLDIIEVIDPGAATGHLDEMNRLFVTAHWAAARLRTDVHVRCGDLGVVIPVARRLALVACKLNAWMGRRDRRAEKRGSDGLDIVRLLQGANWDRMATDSLMVDGLRESVTWAAGSVLVDQAARVARLIQVHTDADPASPDDIRGLGRLLTEL